MDSVFIRQQTRVWSYPKPYEVVKRFFDLMICLLLLPVVIPVMVVCAIAIRLDSSGPAFFIQERIGKDGKPFQMFKFRTMQHNLDDSQHRSYMQAFVKGEVGGGFEEGQTVFKPIKTSQITRVGAVLRKTSLDELPQLFNVFKGEMSIVGPRPNVPWEVDAYEPWHYQRLNVLPGITGLAQVRGRSTISFDNIAHHDIEYVQDCSLLLDFKILWLTVMSVFAGTGAM
jgi:lipopolysaccharide/colanic/teichoic acid biosynthesis glycosyltransferase